MASDEATPKPEISIIRCIQQIRDRTVNVEALDKGTVLQCVEFLKLHGQGSYAIADTLGVSDRYVRRKMAIIRKHNAVKADPQFMAKLLGEFLINTRSHIDHLVQLSHSKDASVAEKSQARYCAAQIESNLITKLLSLGYLAPLGGDIHHKELLALSAPFNILPVVEKPKTENENG